MHNPPHPGLLVKEYLGDVTVTEAAERMDVSRVTLQRIVSGNAGISPDMAYRLSDLFGTSHELWFNLQKNYEMHVAGMAKRPRIAPITSPFKKKTAERIVSARPKKATASATAA